MTIGNILPGFRATGVYQFNPNVILDKLPKPKGTEQTCITASNVEITAHTIKKFGIQHLHLCAAVANTSSWPPPNRLEYHVSIEFVVFFVLYTEILGSHNDSGSVSSAIVSTAGTVCDGSVTSASNPSSIPTVGNYINTVPVPTAE